MPKSAVPRPADARGWWLPVGKMDPVEELELRRKHRRHLETLARKLYVLITMLIERGSRTEDSAWQSIWRKAVERHDGRFARWVDAKTHRKLEHVEPTREHWVRMFNLDPSEKKNVSKYLLNPQKDIEGGPLRNSFIGLNFNQVEEASKVLVHDFHYAPDEALPSLEDENTWSRVFDHALAKITAELDEGKTSVNSEHAEDSWLPASNVQFLTPACFFGREDALAKIGAAFDQDNDRVAVVALHGMRGVGKTTVAATFAHEHRGEYRATWWVNAATDQSIRDSLVSLGLRLRWVPASQSRDLAVATVMENLSNTADDILLIFDNAVEPKAAMPYVPEAGRCRVLITTTWDAWRKDAALIEIDVWPNEIGADFLIARTKGPHDRLEAASLSIELGGLPLALEQAAAYCEHLGVGFADYQRRFQTRKLEFLSDGKYAPDKYGLTVAATFGLAIEEATKLHIAAEVLIVHTALLASDPVPLFLFQDASEALSEPLSSALAAADLDSIIVALRTFALVSRDRSADDINQIVWIDVIRLHRLVREVAAARFDVARATAIRRNLVGVLAKQYPADAKNNAASWPRCAALTPHVLALWQDGVPATPDVTVWLELLDRVVTYLQARGAYRDAALLMARLAEITVQAFGPVHPNTATALAHTAAIFLDRGDLTNARPLLESALEIREQTLPENDPAIADSLDRLGSLHDTLGDHREGRRLLERALAIKENAFGPHHPSVASTLNNLAFVLESHGDIKGAIALLRRSLSIYERRGVNDLDVARQHNNLGKLLMYRDKAEARLHLDRALAMFETLAGPHHPDTAMALQNLGGLMHRTGDLKGAQALLERAFMISSKALLPADTQIGYTLANLAFVYFRRGNPMWRPTLKLAVSNFQRAGLPEVWFLKACFWGMNTILFLYHTLKVAVFVGLPVALVAWLLWLLLTWLWAMF